jgi:hypothetical protein
MGRNAIYLSGWEYNRLVGPDPTTSRQSCLPAEFLWNGAAQLWLFERVYCAKESLECEAQAANAIDMATSRIAVDLAREGILQPFDLSSLPKSSPVTAEFADSHRQLQQDYSESRLRGLIIDGNAGELESIKLQLLRPVTEHLHCVQNVSPNSVTTWFQGRIKQAAGLPASDAVNALVVAARRKNSSLRLGTSLCQAPGTGLNRRVVQAQRHVERTVQRELIPDLLMGLLSMNDYLEVQVQHRDVFTPISNQLWQDWIRNKPKLLRLRELAQQHIWKDLHNEWLPRLEEDFKFRDEFNNMVTDALARARIGPLLDWTTKFVIAGFAAAVGYAATQLSGSPLVGGAVAVAAGGGVKDVIDMKLKASQQLTLFYQRVQRSQSV